MARLALLRHGESEANRGGLFTGALDVPLTPTGRQQSIVAADLLRRHDVRPARILCSPLGRARETAELVATPLGGVTVCIEWRLTERSYGALTGRTKSAVISQYGTAQFREWRRSLDQAPPPMPAEHLMLLRRQPVFRGYPPEAVQPTESLADVIARIRPLLTTLLHPALRSGDVLVVAHGNSLRALVATIDHLDGPALRLLNIPSAQPLVYRADAAGRPVAGSGGYLDPPAAEAAAAALAREGGT